MRTLILASVLVSLPGLAEEPAAPAAPAAEVAPAVEVVKKYLGFVKAKKWAEAKRLTHPKTIARIAEIKKRVGKEQHAMAPWTTEKTESYLVNFKIGSSRAAPEGAFVIETSEDNFQVQEKGVAEGDPASYLVCKLKNAWVVVDKRRNETFSDDSVKLAYKGYCDPPAAAAP